MNILHKILPLINPENIFHNIKELDNVIFLDSSMQHNYYGRYSIILINPLEIFYSLEQISRIYTDICNKIKKTQSVTPDLPFIGGFAGYLSYDLGKQFEYITQDNTRITHDICMGLYNQAFIFDIIKQETHLIVLEVNQYTCNFNQQFNHLYEIYQQSSLLTTVYNHSSLRTGLNFTSNYTQNEYEKIINQAKKYIINGDIFEVNLAQCFNSYIPTNIYKPELLYCKLRQINPAPFSVYLNLDNQIVMSASPERFISIKNMIIETRPIKGTIKRSSDHNLDTQYATELQLSEKDRAENIMIVDLMRNDLSKICEANSINVDTLCGIESFTNLHHLVSVISGKLKNNLSLYDIIKAIFPGGSITGAPKIRSMQIIDELENKKRGVYCGSIGYFSFNENIDLSIAIRSIIINNKNICFYAGGAITLDSIPELEYNETLLKAQKLHEIFT